MNAIEIALREPAEKYKLYPRYDKEADILEVRSKVSRIWQFGIDIDGTIIIDIDADGVLANIELLIPQHLWKPMKSPIGPLQVSRASTLIFTEQSLRHKSFSLPLEVTTDLSRSYVHIRFGQEKQKALWVALSQSCLALVEKSYLLGFHIALETS